MLYGLLLVNYAPAMQKNTRNGKVLLLVKNTNNGGVSELFLRSQKTPTTAELAALQAIGTGRAGTAAADRRCSCRAPRRCNRTWRHCDPQRNLA